MEAHPEGGRTACPLVVLGASVRALAESAQRAGWAVYAADLFRDLDLIAATEKAVRVSAAGGGYPAGLVTAADGFPASAPWCYTGGLENHPDLLAALAAARPLAGNAAEVVERIRDPALVARAAAAAGLSCPETRPCPDGLPTDGSFLVKPLAGAGGRGIRGWTAPTAASWSAGRGPADRPAHVWQRFVSGTPVSAGYVMSAGAARLLGLTRQLVGVSWCHAPRFAWCGGVTVPGSDLAAGFERLGGVLAAAFRTVGAMGVDAVADDAGHINVLEVNPRPTASLELFERSTGISIAAAHLTACGVMAAARPAPQPPLHEPGWQWAKAVLFAARPVAVTPRLIESLGRLASEWTRADGGWAALADIPADGQTLAAGSPALTLFARGRRPDDALDCLHDRVTAMDRLLGTSPPGYATV